MGYNFDVGFMVASVNADLMRWKEDPDNDLGFSKIYCNKYQLINEFISLEGFYRRFNVGISVLGIWC